MKFSVIVPVYNVEKFLAKCLDSIIAQDFDDYEIIAVNDGSKDSSADILSEYLTKTDKLRVITQENKGLGGARNTGIEAAKGEYLVFVDSDDYIAANMLSSFSAIFDDYGFDILAFDCTRVDVSGNRLDQTKQDDDKPVECVYLTQEQFMLFEPTAWAKTYKKSLFTDNDIRFPERLWYEDLATVYRLVPFAKKIGYLRLPLYYYVQQPESITHSANTTRMLEIVNAFSIVQEFFKEKKFFERYYAELEWLCVMHVLYYSAHRFLTRGYYRKQMNLLYDFVKTNFPNFKNNKYIQQKSSNIYQMDWIIEKKFFRFYFKNCLWIKLALLYRRLLRK